MDGDVNLLDQAVSGTLTILFFAFSFSVGAQSGPGGVGATNGTTSLIYWIDANQQTEASGAYLAEVPDLSGNRVSNAIIGNPLLIQNYVNQRSAISFNGIDQQVIADAYINAALYPNLTIVAVYQPNAVYGGGVWGDYESGWEGRYMTDNNFNLPRTSNFVGPGYEPDASHPSGSIPGLFSTNQWIISAVVFREDVVNGTTVRVNGTTERMFTTNHDPGAYNQFVWGAGGHPYSAFPFWFNGNIAELIVFNEALSTFDLISIENYLSAKYNISLADNDLYTGDNTVFDYDVACVGRLSLAEERLLAQGTGIVTIEAQSIGVNEFLLWGHNDGSLAANETSDVPADVEARSERVWFVNEVNGAGDPINAEGVDVTFNLSTFGSLSESDLVLLVDSDGDGLFSDETAIIGAYNLGNYNYQFQNVTSISNGSSFTFGSSDISNTPLPVSLVNFDVLIISDNTLEFRWTTATELSNDHFEIHTSKDGIYWQSILEVMGGGNSNERNSYHIRYNDSHTNGRMYYKLRQVDFDGTSTDIKLIKVERNRVDETTVFPNPASTLVEITAVNFDYVTIYDSRLRMVKTSFESCVPILDLEAGVYLAHIHAGGKLFVKKFVKSQ